jgi:hypothetical protein
MNCLSAAEQTYGTGREESARPFPASTEAPKTSPQVASAVADSRVNLTGPIIGAVEKLRPSLVRG